MERLYFAILVACLGALFSGTVCAEETVAPYPNKPIKLIVPFGAGGGSDTFGRLIQRTIEDNDLLPEPVVIVNVPGGGGTIGSRRAKNAHADGYTLLLLHDAILTARSAGQVPYGPNAFEPIAGTTETAMVIAVADDFAATSLTDLLQQAAAAPDTITIGANLGAPIHFIGLRLQSAANLPNGAKPVFRFVPSGGGADRFAAVTGGHINASAFSLQEYSQFKDGGLRALAVLSSERSTSFPDLPTAKEQGVDLLFTNIQYWWAPKGTPAARIAILQNALAAALQTDDVRELLAQLHINPTFLAGEELTLELARREELAGEVAVAESPALPDVPLLIGLALVPLLLLWGLKRKGAKVYQTRGRDGSPLPSGALPPPQTSTPEEGPDLRTCGIVLATTVAYVLALQFSPLPYPIATFLLVLGLGLLLTPRDRTAQRLAVLPVLALGVGFGVYFLFTRLLTIDL